MGHPLALRARVHFGGHPPPHLQDPYPCGAALAQMQSLADLPQVVMLSEGDGHLDRLAAVASPSRTQGGAIHDARIAALCLHHGVTELWSADRDFRLRSFSGTGGAQSLGGVMGVVGLRGSSEASKSSSTLAPFGSKLKSCQVPAPACWRRSYRRPRTSKRALAGFSLRIRPAGVLVTGPPCCS